MRNVRHLPTDRHGEIYYGPTTFVEADETIQRLWREQCEDIERGMPKTSAKTLAEIVNDIAQMMTDSGYPRISSRIRKEYAL